MPNVLNMFGLRAVIYPNDHRPAHVHVMGAGCEAVYELGRPGGPPTMRNNYGCSSALLLKIAQAVADDLRVLCTRWRDIHES